MIASLSVPRKIVYPKLKQCISQEGQIRGTNSNENLLYARWMHLDGEFEQVTIQRPIFNPDACMPDGEGELISYESHEENARVIHVDSISGNGSKYGAFETGDGSAENPFVNLNSITNHCETNEYARHWCNFPKVLVKITGEIDYAVVVMRGIDDLLILDFDGAEVRYDPVICGSVFFLFESNIEIRGLSMTASSSDSIKKTCVGFRPVYSWEPKHLTMSGCSFAVSGFKDNLDIIDSRVDMWDVDFNISGSKWVKMVDDTVDTWSDGWGSVFTSAKNITISCSCSDDRESAVQGVKVRFIENTTATLTEAGDDWRSHGSMISCEYLKTAAVNGLGFSDVSIGSSYSRDVSVVLDGQHTSVHLSIGLGNAYNCSVTASDISKWYGGEGMYGSTAEKCSVSLSNIAETPYSIRGMGFHTYMKDCAISISDCVGSVTGLSNCDMCIDTSISISNISQGGVWGVEADGGTYIRVGVSISNISKPASYDSLASLILYGIAPGGNYAGAILMECGVSISNVPDPVRCTGIRADTCMDCDVSISNLHMGYTSANVHGQGNKPIYGISVYGMSAYRAEGCNVSVSVFVGESTSLGHITYARGASFGEAHNCVVAAALDNISRGHGRAVGGDIDSGSGCSFSATNTAGLGIGLHNCHWQNTRLSNITASGAGGDEGNSVDAIGNCSEWILDGQGNPIKCIPHGFPGISAGKIRHSHNSDYSLWPCCDWNVSPGM